MIGNLSICKVSIKEVDFNSFLKIINLDNKLSQKGIHVTYTTSLLLPTCLNKHGLLLSLQVPYWFFTYWLHHRNKLLHYFLCISILLLPIMVCESPSYLVAVGSENVVASFSQWCNFTTFRSQTASRTRIHLTITFFCVQDAEEKAHCLCISIIIDWSNCDHSYSTSDTRQSSVRAEQILRIKTMNWIPDMTSLSPPEGRMFLVGCSMGPVLHYWYTWLDKAFVGNAMKTVAKKVLLDQVLVSPAFGMWYFVGKTDFLGYLC